MNTVVHQTAHDVLNLKNSLRNKKVNIYITLLLHIGPLLMFLLDSSLFELFPFYIKKWGHYFYVLVVNGDSEYFQLQLKYLFVFFRKLSVESIPK